MGEQIDIGHGVTIEYFAWADHDPVGFFEYHDRQDVGGPCCGLVTFDLPGAAEAFPGRPLWTVESLEPLTVSPSILCRICGQHGFVRAGRWQPA